MDERNIKNILLKVESIARKMNNPNGMRFWNLHRPRFEYTLKFIINKSGHDRVLDIACAPYLLSIALFINNFEIDGIDWNKGFAKLNPDWKDKLRIRIQDLNKTAELPYETNTFDYVLFTDAIAHIAIRNPDEIIAEAYRVLKTDGTFLLSTPNVTSMGNILKLIKGGNIYWPYELFYNHRLDRINRMFTHKEITNLFERSSFKKYRIFLFNCYEKKRRSMRHLPEKWTRIILFKTFPYLKDTIFVVAKK